MKTKSCLSEQDLILHYYRETPAENGQDQHIENCPLCAKRFTALSNDLSKLPKLSCDPDPMAGTRMAARVNERLSKGRRKWTPAFGVSAVAALALVMTISFWSPQEQPLQTINTTTPLETMNLNENMPDIDFLEDLDLLKEFELLSQIEGV